MTEQKPEEKQAATLQNDEDGSADFVERLKTARQQAGLDAVEEPPEPANLASYALRLATELVAGVIVGAVIGWWIDRTFDTSPFALIGFLMLGFVTGMWNVVRAVKRINEMTGGGQTPPTSDDKTD